MSYLQSAIGARIYLNDKIWNKCYTHLTNQIWKQISKLQQVPMSEVQIREFVTELNSRCCQGIVEMLCQKYPDLRRNSDKRSPHDKNQQSRPSSSRRSVSEHGYPPKQEIVAFDGSMSGRGGFELANWGNDSQSQDFGRYASAFGDVGMSEISRMAKAQDSRGGGDRFDLTAKSIEPSRDRFDMSIDRHDGRFVDTRGSSTFRKGRSSISESGREPMGSYEQRDPYMSTRSQSYADPYRRGMSKKSTSGDFYDDGRRPSEKKSTSGDFYDDLIKERDQELGIRTEHVEIPDFSDDGSGSRPEVLAERKRRLDAYKRGPAGSEKKSTLGDFYDDRRDPTQEFGYAGSQEQNPNTDIYDLYFSSLGQQQQKYQDYQSPESDPRAHTYRDDERRFADEGLDIIGRKFDASHSRSQHMLPDMGSSSIETDFLTPQTSSASLYDNYEGKRTAKSSELDKCLERELAERDYFDRETKQPIQYTKRPVSIDNLPQMSSHQSSSGGFEAAQDGNFSNFGFGQMPQMNPHEISLPTY
jgi:hypothetical protein